MSSDPFADLVAYRQDAHADADGMTWPMPSAAELTKIGRASLFSALDLSADPERSPGQ